MRANPGPGDPHYCSDRQGIPPSFDCAVRRFAYEYGKQTLPRRGEFRTLFDALQLQACNMTAPATHDTWTAPTFPTPSTGTTIFADAAHGSDANPGTLSRPVATLARAVALVRAAAPAKIGHGGTVLLRAGTYYLRDTIVLTPADSGLTIQNYNGEHAIVSGGVPLTELTAQSAADPGAAWREVKTFSGLRWFNGQNNIFGRVAKAGGDCGDGSCFYVKTVASLEECEAAGAATDKGPWTSLTYHAANDTNVGAFKGMCYATRGGRWAPTPEAGVFSGYRVDQRTYAAPLKARQANGGGAIQGLRVNGKRAIRARYPDFDPEMSGEHFLSTDPGMGTGEYDEGWITAGTNWVAPPKKTGKPGDPLTADEIVITAADWPSVEWPMSEKGGSSWTGQGDWGEYHLGANGYCARKGLDPPFGYWCANNPPRGNCWGCGAVQVRYPVWLA